jgi:two-component system response regulator AtoC
MTLLQDYSWPGNIRELENLLKRCVILGSDEAIVTELASHELGRPYTEFTQPLQKGTISLKGVTRQAVQQLERRIIFEALKANNWNRKRVAEVLNISYRALTYKIRQAGLTRIRPGSQSEAAGNRICSSD